MVSRRDRPFGPQRSVPSRGADDTGRKTLFVDPGFCDPAQQSHACFADRLFRQPASRDRLASELLEIQMYAVYVLEDTWRLRATFSTRDAADILAARLVSRGERAKVFRTVEAQRRAA